MGTIIVLQVVLKRLCAHILDTFTYVFLYAYVLLPTEFNT
jgi:hypothetical protein